MADQTNSSSFPSVIHNVVRYLMAHEPDGSGNREEVRYEYTRTLCCQAVWAARQDHRSLWTLVEHLKPNAMLSDADSTMFGDLPQHITFAAVYLGKNELAIRMLESGEVGLFGNTLFGKVFDCATRAANTEFLSRYLSTSYTEYYSSHHYTLLDIAASTGNASTVNFLLLFLPQYRMTPEGVINEHAIEAAAENGSTDVVNRLLDQGGNEASNKQAMIQKILCLACLNDHPDLLLWALENGADISVPVKLHRNLEIPLVWAACRGHNRVVRLLLTRSGKQHANRPHQALYEAVNAGFASTVMLLIHDHVTTCCRVTYREFLNDSDNFIDVLFRVAARRGHTDIVRLFCDLGFDLERFSKEAQTALKLAAAAGHISMVKMLVERGVCVDGEGGSQSPVVAATKNGRDDMVALLVRLGAKNVVEIRDDGAKLFDGMELNDNSRIRIWSAGRYIVDYKKW